MSLGYKKQTLLVIVTAGENGYRWDTFRYEDQVPAPVANLRLTIETSTPRPRRLAKIADTKTALKQQLGTFIDTYFDTAGWPPGDPNNLSEDA